MGRTGVSKEAPPVYKVTLGGKGLNAVLKTYTAEMLRELWRLKANGGPKASSAYMTEHLTGDYPAKVKDYSRASVIFELNDLVAAGYANYAEKTGKGGYHRIYYAVMTEEEFWADIAKQTRDTLVVASGMPNLFNKLA